MTNGPISFSVAFSEAVTGVSTGSFTATNGTVASVTQGVDSSHYTVVVNPTAGVASGNVALSLVAGGATDTAGNAAVAANLSGLDSQGIDTLAPTVTAVTDNVAATVINSPISFHDDLQRSGNGGLDQQLHGDQRHGGECHAG